MNFVAKSLAKTKWRICSAILERGSRSSVPFTGGLNTNRSSALSQMGSRTRVSKISFDPYTYASMKSLITYRLTDVKRSWIFLRIRFPLRTCSRSRFTGYSRSSFPWDIKYHREWSRALLGVRKKKKNSATWSRASLRALTLETRPHDVRYVRVRQKSFSFSIQAADCVCPSMGVSMEYQIPLRNENRSMNPLGPMQGEFPTSTFSHEHRISETKHKVQQKCWPFPEKELRNKTRSKIKRNEMLPLFSFKGRSSVIKVHKRK